MEEVNFNFEGGGYITINPDGCLTVFGKDAHNLFFEWVALERKIGYSDRGMCINFFDVMKNPNARYFKVTLLASHINSLCDDYKQAYLVHQGDPVLVTGYLSEFPYEALSEYVLATSPAEALEKFKTWQKEGLRTVI